MGTSYWLRDNAIIGARFLHSHDTTRRRLGLQLLLSGLTFMASIAQRDRFKAMIRSKQARYTDDPRHWPHIFADIKSNLSCQTVEGWAHKQDAWQILAFHVLGAIETKHLSVRELSPAHREFLALIIPFLVKVECWKCENSGSWEEIPSVRTSVRAWEHRLIVKLGELSGRAEYKFLNTTYSQVRRHLPSVFRGRSLRETVDVLD